MKIPIQDLSSSSYLWEDGEFYCQHDGDIEIEDTEVDTIINGVMDSYRARVAVCADCDKQIFDYNFEEDFDER